MSDLRPLTDGERAARKDALMSWICPVCFEARQDGDRGLRFFHLGPIKGCDHECHADGWL